MIYDKTATATTAVTAFLSQFKVSANGDIRYVSGSDTFHIWWLHRALQKIAYDFNTSGDDELNLTKPNPSTSEALGTIITLQDHTSAYSVLYNINDTVANYLFGGSIEQGASGSKTKYYGLKVLGSVNSSTYLQIVQDGGLLTSHWGTGKNQTDSSTLLRVIIKCVDAGTEIDNSVVNVKANKWGDTFAIWETTLGLGESVAAINTFSDPQNTTSASTVGAYLITKSEGYKLIDVDGNGDKPFIGEWSYGAYNKKALYEYVKWLLRYGTSSTLYGMDGDLWTGRLYDCTIDAGSGTWVQNETLSWGTGATAGTGHLVGVDNTSGSSTARLIIHLDTGVIPVDNTVVTGNGSATGTLNGNSSKITSVPNLLGTYTGSAWIGADGMGFEASELGSNDSVKDLDGNTISPPNNVTATVKVDGATNSHVILAIKDGSTGGIDETQYTADSGNNSGDSTFVINENIASDTPASGFILVKEGTTFEPIEYTSWSSKTFTLVGTLSKSYTSGKDVIVPILYDNISSDGGSVSNTLVYSSDIDVVGWVRHGVPGSPSKPVNISGTIGTAGLSLSVQLDSE